MKVYREDDDIPADLDRATAGGADEGEEAVARLIDGAIKLADDEAQGGLYLVGSVPAIVHGCARDGGRSLRGGARILRRRRPRRHRR
jgi:hypothetical protein